MNNTYQLTSQIWEQIKRIEQAEGIKIEVEFQKGIFYDETNGVEIDNLSKMLTLTAPKWYTDKVYGLVEADQIKDILIALEGVLRENPEFIHLQNRTALHLDYNDSENSYENGFTDGQCSMRYILIAESKSQALYQDWCCGWPKSRFETEPEKVLSELLEILKGG